MSLARWIPDTSVKRCYECGVHFSMMTRRHHCRMCGRIFCAACSPFFARIPPAWQTVRSPPTRYQSVVNWAWQKWKPGEEDMVVGSPNRHTRHATVPHDATERRVCRDCSGMVEVTLHHEDLFQLLLVLGPWGVGPKQWEVLWYCTKAWRKTVEVIFYQWDSLLHIMPYERASLAQRRLMTSLASFLSPEHLWWSTLAAREKIPLPRTFVPLTCVDMGCHIFCDYFPPSVRALVSLILGDRDIATRQFSELEDVQAVGRCMVNVLAASCAVDHYLVADILVPLCQKSEDVAIMVYFALRARDADVARTLYNHLPRGTKDEIIMSVGWINAMVKVSNVPEKDRSIYAKFDGPARLPMRPHIEVIKILDASVIQKKSSSQPRVIPCQCRVRGQAHVFVKCFMMKTEDVRPDAFVMDFMRLLDLCLQKIGDTPYENVTYDILPLTRDSGMVCLIPGARTLYSLYHENGMTLQNWVIENNTNFSIDYIRGRFVRSCAFSTTTSMMLQIGDRHLENILMTRQGLLFHVDFATILGREPNHMKSIVGNDCRITPQMLDFLGGTTSTYYKTFQKSCGHVYTTARRCILPLYSVMMALVYDNYCTQAELDAVVQMKFCPGQKTENARVRIEDRVDRESGYVSWSDTLNDVMHHLFQKAT